MNSDLQTQTSQEEAELGLHLGHQDYGHPLHSQPGYTSQVSPSLITSLSVLCRHHHASQAKILDWSAN